MSKSEETFSILLSLVLVFAGFILGEQTERRRIVKSVSAAEDLSLIEVIDEHIFITNLSAMVTLMPSLDPVVAGGYIGNGRIFCLPTLALCQHEVGHALDNFLGFPSETEEFKYAVEGFIEGCIEEDIVNFFCSIKDWAGVNGNPIAEIVFSNGDIIEWGGYGELYAHIFELSHTNLLPIPKSLNWFYLGDGINW